jgi:hypothetical protein
MDRQTNRFDVQTVKDVVLHLRYTARDGGQGLHDDALADLDQIGSDKPSAWRLFSLRTDFPEQWKAFTQPGSAATAQTATLAFVPSKFRRILGNRKLKITEFYAFLRWNEDKYTPNSAYLRAWVSAAGATAVSRDLDTTADYGTVITNSIIGTPLPKDVKATDETGYAAWTFEVRASDSNADTGLRVSPTGVLQPDAVQDVWFICKTARRSA